MLDIGLALTLIVISVIFRMRGLMGEALQEVLILILISILWCEAGYYYYTFYVKCGGWPGHSQEGNMTRVMIVADTHIMGPIKSFRVDKWLREWEMRRSFSISNGIYEPEVILFLGDLLDEGSFSPDSTFTESSRDFERVFAYDQSKQERIIIPGNHDVGFHNSIIHYPYVSQRFRERFPSTFSIELVDVKSKLRDSNFVVSNSMTFYNDFCDLCAYSVGRTNHLASFFQGQKEKLSENFPEPVLLTHIPLYRKNDASSCEYPNSLAEKVKEDNKEGGDVLHKKASEFLLERLRPRLILSGHTHLNCKTKHQFADDGYAFEELTVTSYNPKYAESQPGFMLMSVNSTHILTKTCNLIEEWVIASVYVATVLLICLRIAFFVVHPRQLSSPHHTRQRNQNLRPVRSE